ncbi:pancreatic lipase-related protein 2-like isoform X2 [Uranotaenia lowii]|nr:pancreatic lipase-related protein 2-like isoform X2 [Uranotaenia lowii]
MRDLRQCLCFLRLIIAVVIISNNRITVEADRVSGDVQLLVYNRSTSELAPIETNTDKTELTGCTPGEIWTLIVHGWREGTLTEWVPDMLNMFQKHRGGCVMFMVYANNIKDLDYFGELVPQFDHLSDVLVDYLRFIEKAGFDPADGLLFGFSFGAHMSFEAGRRFGIKKLGRIDVCEPANPGFDSNVEYSFLDPMVAAKKVQCIHTSDSLGTSFRKCHINWNMGNCGKSQIAAGPYPKGSHGLCPYFYNSAFEHEFSPVPKPVQCSSNRPISEWPKGFRMGYYCDMDSGIHGDLFSPTVKNPPYNEDTTLNEIH